MKTVCIYHSIDLDGFMSAAIVKHWFNQQEVPNKEGEPINTIDFIGYNYGQPIPDLSEYDKVIMCDVSFPKEIMYDLCEKRDDDFEFIYIDHHISAINDLERSIKNSGTYTDYPAGLWDVNFAACELTWKYFFPEPDGADYHAAHIPSNLKGENIVLPKNKMPEIVRLLGRYDCFGHKQVWKSVVGYEGLYEVSNHGNVRSLDRTIIENNTGKKRSIKGINLSIANSKRGYRVVVLCKDGNEKMKNVHQLVAQAFISNPENKPCINHKDFNRLNNHIENLEWCTYAENNLHSVDEGKKGKTVIQLTKDGEFVEQFDSLKRAESHTGIASQNIGKVCKGEREFAGEYKWEYGVDKDVFLQFVPEDEELKVLQFQYAARESISDYEEAYSALCNDIDHNITEEMIRQGIFIYNYLCTDAKQSYKNGFKIELGTKYYGGIDPIDENTKVQIFTKGFNFICINKERFNPINFGIDYHSDGYDGAMCWHLGSDKMVNISFYNDNGKVDCSAIAKSFGGGGHRGAAGCRMNIKDFQNLIINKLWMYISIRGIG